MDFQSAMETFAEAWVAANAGQQSQALALTRAANAAAVVAAANAKSPNASSSASASLADLAVKKEHSLSPPHSVVGVGVGVAGEDQHSKSSLQAKSLPLHCVVESVHSLHASLTIDTRQPWKRRPNIETDS
ncbi:GD11656 [Drosophila simulans]|uniref:GD11656 n=1 Tax=Drosophila simulans TaxID=7240 RepID=B4QH38_DROSI|nr:GD11656 [Drosophila simulans]